jgi:hypothetical protein
MTVKMANLKSELRFTVGAVVSLTLTLLLLSSEGFSQAVVSPTDVLLKWRSAVHAEKQAHSRLAVLSSNSNEDGIPGSVDEWIEASSYRVNIKREHDETESVVTPQLAKFRDWNGFVRDLQGKELSRLQTEIFEKRAIVFGPPVQLPEASVAQSDDKKTYLLRTTPVGGVAMRWYIDATTWLPVKSVRSGDDTEITTTYSQWSETGGMLTPGQTTVSETDKPDYQCQQTSLRFEKKVPRKVFNAPEPGLWDVKLAPDALSIPFTMESAHIVFQVGVNGSKPVGFLLDTGSDENVINTPWLAEFGLKTYAKTAATGGGGTAEYDYAAGATFTTPGVELRNQHVAVMDQTGLERALGVPLGGLLGYDFISRFVVEIDYQKNLITLHDPRTWNYRGNGYVVPVTFDGGIPFTNGVISIKNKTIPGFFVLDFGAQETMTLTSPFVKANDLVSLAQTNAFVNRPSGLENQFFSQNNVRGRIDKVELGKLVEQSIPVNMSVNTKGAYAGENFSGTIGETIFRRYHVFLDYARNRVIFEPTVQAREPFPERKTYGLSIIASGADLHTYTVTAVRPGSQAEKDGFKKADVISAMNGNQSTQFTLRELRDELTHEGESCRLGVSRGSEALTVPVQIKLVSLDRN